MTSSQTHLAMSTATASLPATWYYDEVHYRQELQTLWRTNWVYVCRAASVAEPLQYQTIVIGQQNIVVLRDAEGSLQAFHNTCRHRGSILCPEHSGTLTSKALVCPYHQWSYSSKDGRLIATSSFAEPTGFCRDDYSLFKVALAQWRGCVFVNLDKNAQWSRDTAFQREPDSLPRFPLESMVTGHIWRTEIACNWKVFWENFNECLHCPAIHPELCELVPLYSRRIVDPKDLPGWEQHRDSKDPKYRGGLSERKETWSMDGSAQGHTIATLSAEDIARGQAYATSLPGMFIGAYADHVRIVRVLPTGPESTELVAEWLYEKDTLDDPDYDLKNTIDFGVLVMEQDRAACELNQRGLHSSAFTTGVLMPEEYYVKIFHDWVRSNL